MGKVLNICSSCTTFYKSNPNFGTMTCLQGMITQPIQHPVLLQGQFADPPSGMAMPGDAGNLQNFISISIWIFYFFMSHSFLFLSIYDLLKLSTSTLLVFSPLTSVLEENGGKTGETQTLHIILNLSADRNKAKRTFWKMTAFPQSCLLHLGLQKSISLKKWKKNPHKNITVRIP